MMNQIFIMLSFLLGVIVGSLVTYVFMGNIFSKALAEIKSKNKSIDEDGGDVKSEHHDDKISTNVRKNTILIVMLCVIVAILFAVGYFISVTGDTVASNSGEAVADSLSKEHDIGSINNAIRKGSGGY